MASNRTFYRTTISIEVLSEEPLSGDEDLSDIEYLIGDGGCSGKVSTIIDNEEVDGPHMAQLLLDQGSEPGFFRIDEEGNDLDDDGEDGSEPENGDDSEEHRNHVCLIANEKIVLCRGHIEERRLMGQEIEEEDLDEGVCQDCSRGEISEIDAQE